MKKCIVCNFPKEIKKEDNKKYKINMIHEYNYSCYECLDNMKKQKEKELLDIYEKMIKIGIIERELVVQRRNDKHSCPSCSHT